MQAEIVAGRPSELEYWNGAVVRLGREAGVSDPPECVHLPEPVAQDSRREGRCKPSRPKFKTPVGPNTARSRLPASVPALPLPAVAEPTAIGSGIRKGEKRNKRWTYA